MSSTLIEKLRKLQALAQRGEGGEAENARRILYDLMGRHGVTLDEIEQEKPEKVKIPYYGINEEFVIQIIASEIGQFQSYRLQGEEKKKIIYIDVQPSIGRYIISKIEFFWDLYQKELEKFYEAFLLKNDLYCKDDGSNKRKDPSPEEMERLLDVIQMAKNIKRETMNKTLN